jgi:hypothetical protein
MKHEERRADKYTEWSKQKDKIIMMIKKNRFKEIKKKKNLEINMG